MTLRYCPICRTQLLSTDLCLKCHEFRPDGLTKKELQELRLSDPVKPKQNMGIVECWKCGHKQGAILDVCRVCGTDLSKDKLVR